MASERKLKGVGPLLFTANGQADGIVTISSTNDFKVKAKISIVANTLPTLSLEIKRVISSTQLIVGRPGNINAREDLSLYTTALSSSILQPEQDRPNIPADQVIKLVYEEEPTVAIRNLLVDRLGNPYDVNNPVPTSAVLEADNVELNVEINAFDPDLDSALSVGSEDGTKTGAKHVLKVRSDGSLETNINRPHKEIFTRLNMAIKDTFYSYTFPNFSQNLLIKVRNNTGYFRIYDSNIGDPLDFMTIPSGAYFKDDNIETSSLTLYFQGSKDNMILEIGYCIQ